jgi:hypothetical protein
VLDTDQSLVAAGPRDGRRIPSRYEPIDPLHSRTHTFLTPTLLAGVEQEEGGEKWRAGDSQKAMRFFMRAIEIYDSGITKYPNSFDLAYNKYVYTSPDLRQMAVRRG